MPPPIMAGTAKTTKIPNLLLMSMLKTPACSCEPVSKRSSRRQAQILILEILQVFLWLKFSPSLTLDKIEHFETGSFDLPA